MRCQLRHDPKSKNNSNIIFNVTRYIFSNLSFVSWFSLQAHAGGDNSNEKKEELIRQLEDEKKQLEMNPDLPLANTTKMLRQKNFKAIYRKRKTINLELSLEITDPQPTPLQIIYPTNNSGDQAGDNGSVIDSDDQE